MVSEIDAVCGYCKYIKPLFDGKSTAVCNYECTNELSGYFGVQILSVHKYNTSCKMFKHEIITVNL